MQLTADLVALLPPTRMISVMFNRRMQMTPMAKILQLTMNLEHQAPSIQEPQTQPMTTLCQTPPTRMIPKPAMKDSLRMEIRLLAYHVRRRARHA